MVRVGPQRHRGENIAHFVGYYIINCQYTDMNTIYLSVLSYLSVFHKTQCMFYLDCIFA
jgi:hypothetical protein